MCRVPTGVSSMGLRKLVSGVLGPPDLDEVLMVFHVIGGTPGIMVDVGAHQGYALAPFLERKWTVHAFEPDPANRAILSSRCPSATIDPRAVSQVDGEKVPLFTSDISTGISTLSPFHTTHTPTTTVQTVRLDTYLRERDVEKVDFLKTDIEGFDLFALRSFPWNDHHPKAVVCEFEDNKTTRLGHDVHDIAHFLEQHGYSVVVSEWEPITEYGTRHKWRRFVNYPTELASDSWGNLIAVDPSLLETVQRAGRSTARRLRLRQSVDRLRQTN
jgi:FkbM family methyltransferase